MQVQNCKVKQERLELTNDTEDDNKYISNQ